MYMMKDGKIRYAITTKQNILMVRHLFDALFLNISTYWSKWDTLQKSHVIRPKTVTSVDRFLPPPKPSSWQKTFARDAAQDRVVSDGKFPHIFRRG